MIIKPIDNKKFYDEDEEFRDYVSRYCSSRNVTVDEALKHKLVSIQHEIIVSERKYRGVVE